MLRISIAGGIRLNLRVDMIRSKQSTSSSKGIDLRNSRNLLKLGWILLIQIIPIRFLAVCAIVIALNTGAA